ncbi:MAG: uridine kinase [Candidatus Krumholzibacteriia bacterium]|nr:uridine kinase [bacterium]MCB9514827.1 uridine kinase [Candidatus Latescibacterota bacterium]
MQRAPVVIGIAGGTGSGKTSVALKLKSFFPYERVVLLHHDSYYHDNSHLPATERERINYDHPEAFQTDLLIEHLDRLRGGEEVVQPRYDYETHSRLAEGTPVEPADIILLEGILVLEHEALRRRMDIRIYIDADPDERFIRRLQRDIRNRERTVASIVDQYQQTVRPMHLRFVEPSKRYADLIVPEGVQNAVAIDLLVAKIRDELARRKADDERESAP